MNEQWDAVKGSQEKCDRVSHELKKDDLISVCGIQSCLILCDPMDYEILQARIMEWVAFPSSKGSNPGLPHCRWILYQLNHQGSPRILEWEVYPFFRGSSRPRN